jgi:predicted FMN-binding regulatory protein PaiB
MKRDATPNQPNPNQLNLKRIRISTTQYAVPQNLTPQYLKTYAVPQNQDDFEDFEEDPWHLNYSPNDVIRHRLTVGRNKALRRLRRATKLLKNFNSTEKAGQVTGDL